MPFYCTVHLYLPVPEASVSPVPWHRDIADLAVGVSVPGDAIVHDPLDVEESEEELGGHPGVELQGGCICVYISDHLQSF